MSTCSSTQTLTPHPEESKGGLEVNGKYDSRHWQLTVSPLTQDPRVILMRGTVYTATASPLYTHTNPLSMHRFSDSKFNSFTCLHENWLKTVLLGVLRLSRAAEWRQGVPSGAPSHGTGQSKEVVSYVHSKRQAPIRVDTCICSILCSNCIVV